MNKLNLNKLHVFYTLGMNGTATAAAVNLGVTPPTISQHLRELEKQFGGKLWEYNMVSRTGEFTPRGKALFDMIWPIMQEAEKLENRLYPDNENQLQLFANEGDDHGAATAQEA